MFLYADVESSSQKGGGYDSATVPVFPRIRPTKMDTMQGLIQTVFNIVIPILGTLAS